jgi:transcriptional regulator with XRE-family HTH domain
MPPQRSPRSRQPIRHLNRIRHYRLLSNLTQRELGVAVGRKRKAISLWERGTTLPSAPELFRLAKVLNTFVEALYPSLFEAARKPMEQSPA